MTKRNILNIETDDLLKQLEEAPEGSEENYESDDLIVQFIRKYNLKAGTTVFKGSQLYKLFKLTFQVRMAPHEFTKYLSFHLPRMDSTYTAFLLDGSTFSISKEIEDILRKQKFSVTKRIKFVDYYNTFLKEMGIKKGTKWVSINEIYDLWRKWRLEIKKIKGVLMSRERFKIFLDRTFKHKTVDLLEYYQVNISRSENEEKTE